jgi:hypothetical protein
MGTCVRVIKDRVRANEKVYKKTRWQEASRRLSFVVQVVCLSVRSKEQDSCPATRHKFSGWRFALEWSIRAWGLRVTVSLVTEEWEGSRLHRLRGVLHRREVIGSGMRLRHGVLVESREEERREGG